jgi:hypothetical protein
VVYRGDTQYTAWLHSTYMHRWSVFFGLGCLGLVFGTRSGSSLVAFSFIIIIIIIIMAERSTTTLFFSHVPCIHTRGSSLGNEAFTGDEASVSTFVMVYSS